jgi:hypothetical protein
VPLFVDHKIWINRIEVIFRPRAQNEPLIHPVEVGTGRVKSLIGEKGNA